MLQIVNCYTISQSGNNKPSCCHQITRVKKGRWMTDHIAMLNYLVNIFYGDRWSQSRESVIWEGYGPLSCELLARSWMTTRFQERPRNVLSTWHLLSGILSRSSCITAGPNVSYEARTVLVRGTIRILFGKKPKQNNKRKGSQQWPTYAVAWKEREHCHIWAWKGGKKES